MLGKKEQTRAFLIVALVYGTWHATAEWAKLLTPFLMWDAQMTMFQIGLINTIGNGFVLIGTFVVGHLLDTVGAKFAGMVAAFITGLFYIMSSQAKSFTTFLCLQPVRMAFCLNQVSEAYLASTSDENERTRVIMRLGVPLGLASIVGPWLASKTAIAFDLRGSLICAGIALVVVALPLLLFALPEQGHLPQSKRPRMIRFTEYKEMLQSKPLRVTLLIRFLLDGPYQAYDALSRQYMIAQFLSDTYDLSYLFIAVGATTVFANTVLIKILQKRFRPQQLLHLALIILTISYIVISFLKEFYQLLIIMPIQVIGLSIAYAELSAQTVNAVDRHYCGKAVGLGHAVQLLAATLTSVIAGYFISEFDFAIWCYIAAAVSSIGVLILPYVGGYMNQQMDRLPSLNKNF